MNKKPHRLTIALDDEVYTKLKEAQKEAHMSKVDVIRQLILIYL